VLNAKLKPVWSDEERSADRYRLLLEANAGLPEAGTQAVRIHDLSATGFLLESDAALEVGTEISLDIPGAGAAAGDVVWSSGSFAGGQFREMLSPDALAAARSGSRVVWPDFARKSAADRASETSAPAIADDRAQAVADERWPLPRRLQFIVGASVLLWTPVALGIWAAVG
jgi:hypothetical protein